MIYKGNFNEKDKKIIEAGNDLFNIIFGPHYKKRRLPKGTKIYVVPHRQLSYLPWNALSVIEHHDGDNYMVDHYNVSTLPCATALSKLKGQRAENEYLVKKPNSFFIGPNVDSAPDKIRFLNSVGSWNIYTDEKANVRAALNELQNSETVIFFTHAIFDISAPNESYIQLAGQTNKSCLSFKDIEKINIGADFVVLAGCATGKVGRYSELGSVSQEEKFLDADDLLGLYKQMISKGVKNLVFSAVNETSKDPTEMFLGDLVEQINNNLSSSEAFGQSVKNLKKHKHYYHPYYWGAYVLVGPFSKK
ncbi:MAG: CHAT domain-containing protein [Desulfobacteraceae bacterium]|nr:CHAT domain-containing protein [Desulfobacteraceae bacterium]